MSRMLPAFSSLRSSSHARDASMVISSEPISPVVLGADNSQSMAQGGAIDELNQGLAQFARDIATDRLLAHALRVALFTFGLEEPVRQVTGFVAPAEFRPPRLKAETNTPFCQMVCRAVATAKLFQDEVQERHDQDVRPSWVFLGTDGLPTDLEHLEAAIQATRDFAVRFDIEVFLIGMGAGADLEFLSRLAQPGRPPLRMAGIDSFRRFFRWLYVSLRRKSQSRPGEALRLPPPVRGDDEAPGWAAKG